MYFDFFLRNELIFFATSVAFGAIPWMTSDILRLSGPRKLYAKMYGFGWATAFLSASIWVSSREGEVFLFQFAGRWLPVIVGLPSVIAGAYVSWTLTPTLQHRRTQILFFSTLVSAGTIAWWISAGSLFSFRYIPYPELWDIGLFGSLAISTVLDFRFLSRRAERADKVVPKWFSSFLASGIDHVTLEMPLVAMAVDTVSYTKLLANLDAEGKSKLHAAIRERMAPLVEKFGAQKLSDRGDGALFGWDFSGNEEARRSFVRLAIAAGEYLAIESENSVGIKFRIGIAVGIVRCELKGSETSFLGEPLNAASRLEAMAKPGTMLLHETIVPYVNAKTLEKDWVSVELKGVEYRAVGLRKVD